METLSLSQVGEERSCVVIGSGSTAASAIAALSELGATRITIAARNQQKATPLLNICRDLAIEGSVSGLDDVPVLLADAQYAISTIPAYAADDIAHAVAQRSENVLQTGEYSGLTLLDVVYDPRPTDLMAAAGRGGATCVGGEHMLLWQAVVQVALMTGIDQRRVPVAAMRDKLKRAIEEK
jgi:shikimate dehydrogenase